MTEFKKYRRTGLSEMRPYIKGEDLTGISVSKEDNPEEDMGMIARNPKNHKDQWYVARKYFEDNLEEVIDKRNKNRFLIEEIRDTMWGQKVVALYIIGPDDPKHDDLPSEILKRGKEYHVDFTPTHPDPLPEFNTGDKKK